MSKLLMMTSLMLFLWIPTSCVGARFQSLNRAAFQGMKTPGGLNAEALSHARRAQQQLAVTGKRGQGSIKQQARSNSDSEEEEKGRPTMRFSQSLPRIQEP